MWTLLVFNGVSRTDNRLQSTDMFQERILIPCCICSWNTRDLLTRPETNTRRILHIHKNVWNQSHRTCVTNWWLLHKCILLLLYSFHQSTTLRMLYYRRHSIISLGTHLLTRFRRTHLLLQWIYHEHRLQRLCSRIHLLVWFRRLVQGEFRFLRYFTHVWKYTSTTLLHSPRTASSSSRFTIYIAQGHRGSIGVYSLFFFFRTLCTRLYEEI